MTENEFKQYINDKIHSIGYDECLEEVKHLKLSFKPFYDRLCSDASFDIYEHVVSLKPIR